MKRAKWEMALGIVFIVLAVICAIFFVAMVINATQTKPLGAVVPNHCDIETVSEYSYFVYPQQSGTCYKQLGDSNG